MDVALRILSIGAGGFCGAIARYIVSSLMQARTPIAQFPFGTMTVNLVGCFFIGLCTMLVESRGMFSLEMRSFILIGFLGAFTTFSTYSNDTLNLLHDGRLDLALLNSVGQVIVGLFMVWLGRLLVGVILR